MSIHSVRALLALVPIIPDVLFLHQTPYCHSLYKPKLSQYSQLCSINQIIDSPSSPLHFIFVLLHIYFSNTLTHVFVFSISFSLFFPYSKYQLHTVLLASIPSDLHLTLSSFIRRPCLLHSLYTSLIYLRQSKYVTLNT